jgi:hypothetical protein
MSVRLSFIGKTDCPISTRDMIKEGFEIPEDKYIVEFWDVQSEDYLTKPVLTNQQIETIIKRLKGTHKEDRILHLRKFMQAQKIKIVDKDFMVENMKFIQNSKL